MALSVKEILDRRRMESEEKNRKKIAAVYEANPRLKEIDKLVQKLNIQRINDRINGLATEKTTNEVLKLRREKDQILSKLGIEAKDLEPSYFCEECKDTGSVNGKTCSCKKQLITKKLYDQSEIENRIKKENFSKFKPDLFRKSRQADEDESPYENIQRIRKNMESFLDNFGVGSPNLYFFGQVGTGKTFMVNCIAKELMDKGVAVLYQSSNELHEFLGSYRFMYPDQKAQFKDKNDLIYNVDVLVIDDLGTEHITEVSKSNLFEVINRRIISQKTTIISSNIDIYEIDSYYDKRISSRIMGEYKPVLFYGNDVRLA